MHAEVVSINVGSDGHGLEAADEALVDFLVVELLEDLGAEGEVFRHCARLVISAEHDNIAGIVQLYAKLGEGENLP